MKIKTTFRRLLSMLLTACMLVSMAQMLSVKSDALYGLDGITGSGTKDDPAVVDTWLELKCALEAATDAYITVDAGDFGHTTNNGYSYLFKSLHYPSGSFITVPAGYTKNVRFTSYTLKFVASPEASNGPLENFILNRGNLTIDGLGKLNVGFNTTSGGASIFKNEGSLTFTGGMEFSTDHAEVDGVKAMVVNNSGYLRINGGYFTGSNNAKSGPNKGGYSYAINTGAGTGIQTEIYGGVFNATNTSGGEITVGIYNPALYANNNTTKLYGGFYYGIWNIPDTGSSMNSLDNCLGNYRVYREGEDGEKIFNGKGITYVEADKKIRVSNLMDWIDFTSTPEIESGNVAPEETFTIGTDKEYGFTPVKLPEWLTNEGYYVVSSLSVFRENGDTINASNTSFNLKELTEADHYRIAMFSTLKDSDGNWVCESKAVFPVVLCEELIESINVDIERPLPGRRATDIKITTSTPNVKIKNIDWCIVTGSGSYDFTSIDPLDRFKAGESYKCWITFAAEDGSVFADGINATFNGDNGEKGSIDDKEATFCWDFLSREYISFDNVVLPNAGDSALKPFYYDFDASGSVHVPNFTWYTADGTEFTDEFVAGENYYVVIEVAQNDGSNFLKDPSLLDVTFNGVSVPAVTKEGSNNKAILIKIDAAMFDYYMAIDDFDFPTAGDISDYEADFSFDTNMECKVAYVSFYDMEGNEATNLVAGKDYVASFYIISPKFPTIKGINVTINGKNADGYQIRISRDVGVIEQIFTAQEIPFIFTEESTFYVGGRAELDLEAMAEYSEVFMEAFFEESLYITWLKVEDSVFRGPMASAIRWDDNHAGCTYSVEIKIGEDFTIRSDTFIVSAEEYVEEPDVLRGDANSDGKVNMKDAIAICKHIADWQDVIADMEAADANLDGKVNVKDVAAILKYIANGAWS